MMRNVIICIPHQMLFRLANQEDEMKDACSTYGGETHTVFLWRNLREVDGLEDLGVDGR
jgi:hypothetical protein